MGRRSLLSCNFMWFEIWYLKAACMGSLKRNRDSLQYKSLQWLSRTLKAPPPPLFFCVFAPDTWNRYIPNRRVAFSLGASVPNQRSVHFPPRLSASGKSKQPDLTSIVICRTRIDRRWSFWMAFGIEAGLPSSKQNFPAKSGRTGVKLWEKSKEFW